jgi:hypothetical protein
MITVLKCNRNQHNNIKKLKKKNPAQTVVFVGGAMQSCACDCCSRRLTLFVTF